MFLIITQCFDDEISWFLVNDHSDNKKGTCVQAITKWHILVESLVISCEMCFCVKYYTELSST